MQKYEIQKLRDLPIEKVAEEMGMKVERHKALCPFHDDHHASLTFNTRKNNCRCYVCMSNSVGTIDLVMRFLRKDFLWACRWLAEVNGVYLEEDRKREATYSASYSASSPASYSASSPEGSSSSGSFSGDDSGGSSSEDNSDGSSSGNDSGGSSSEDDSGGSFSGDDSGGSSSERSSSFDASRYARFFEHPWLNEAARRFLFEERKIDWRVANWCRLTSWTDRNGVNWLQIPYFSTEGKLIGIQNRNLDYKKNQKILRDAKVSSSLKDSVDSEVSSSLKNSSSQATSSSSKNSVDSEISSSLKDSVDSEDSQDTPRFRFPYGARCSIYNLPVVKMLKPGEQLFITEGCSDCWAMLSAGHKAIAIPSATLLKPDDKKWLAEIGSQLKIEWHMFPDRDAPGESLFLQLKEILPSLVHHQLPPGCKDFSEYYLKEKK